MMSVPGGAAATVRTGPGNGRCPRNSLHSDCTIEEKAVVLQKKDNEGFGFVLRGAKGRRGAPGPAACTCVRACVHACVCVSVCAHARVKDMPRLRCSLLLGTWLLDNRGFTCRLPGTAPLPAPALSSLPHPF